MSPVFVSVTRARLSFLFAGGIMFCGLTALWAQPTTAPAETLAGTAGEAEAPAQQRGAAGAASMSRLSRDIEENFRERLQVLQDGEAQKRLLLRQQEELQRQRERLGQLQEEVELRYKALRLVQAELAASLQQRNPDEEGERERSAEDLAARQQEIARLSRIFEKMKPAAAARVVEEMDSELAVAVLGRINGRQAAKILANVPPQLAARLSTQMAGRNRARRRRGR